MRSDRGGAQRAAQRHASSALKPAMMPFRRGAPSREPLTLPLFPLKAVLFPGGLLPLKVFEQRYIDMTKTCLKEDQPFGVCLLTRGEEVAQRSAGDPYAASGSVDFAPIGTQARIVSWDMPQLGILHLKNRATSATTGWLSHTSRICRPNRRPSFRRTSRRSPPSWS
jgi:hypothetical protein